MTIVIDIHEAETQLSELIQRAENGEEIYISIDGSPVIRIMPKTEEKLQRPAPGLYDGKIKITSDFNSPLDIPGVDSGISREEILNSVRRGSEQDIQSRSALTDALNGIGHELHKNDVNLETWLDLSETSREELSKSTDETFLSSIAQLTTEQIEAVVIGESELIPPSDWNIPLSFDVAKTYLNRLPAVRVNSIGFDNFRFNFPPIALYTQHFVGFIVEFEGGFGLFKVGRNPSSEAPH